MINISAFVNLWNTSSFTLSDVVMELLRLLWNQAFFNLLTSFKSEARPVGLSQVGKPLIELAFQKVASQQKLPNDNKMSMIWHLTQGHIGELLLLAAMKSWGVAVSKSQDTVYLLDTPGHIDGVYTSPLGKKYVLEIKTMSASYFKSFTRQPSDDRGYLSQATAYALALDLKEVVFICLNKATGEIVDVHYHVQNSVIEQVKKKLEALHLLSYEDIKNRTISVPEPRLVRGTYRDRKSVV